MAAVGLRYFVAARIKTETRGQEIEYDKGIRLGPARAANVTYERNNAPLYGDDVIQDEDNGMLGGSIETETTQMTGKERSYVLGEETVEGKENEYEGTDDAAPYVGCGYFRVLRQNRKTVFEAWWYHKTQFSENSMNAQTKGASIEWQTPKMTGRIMGVNIDSSGKNRFYRRAEFETEAEAIAWLSIHANMVAEYSNGQTYAVGDLALHEGTVYSCTKAIERAEEWTAEHWQAVEGKS